MKELHMYKSNEIVNRQDSHIRNFSTNNRSRFNDTRTQSELARVQKHVSNRTLKFVKISIVCEYNFLKFILYFISTEVLSRIDDTHIVRPIYKLTKTTCTQNYINMYLIFMRLYD